MNTWWHRLVGLMGLALVGFETRAEPLVAGGLSFSDELGGFRLVSAQGSGTLEDPIILVEEITQLRPAVLVVRLHGPPPVNRSGVRGSAFLNVAIVKVVLNASQRVWAGFDIELQSELRQPSVYGDGLSFDQMNSFSGQDVVSDSFLVGRRLSEPYDRLRFQEGSVDPGAVARFTFYVTDPTPRPEFYIVQEPRLLMAERPPPAQRPALAHRP